MSVTIRPPTTADESRWRELFAAYNTFYRSEVPPAIVDVTWQRILDPASPVNALVAELDGQLVGMTNYLYHLSTWEESPSCYLEDLFVDKAFRGGGAARALIEGVEAAAREYGAFRLYWHTQVYNSAARSLYDTVATPSSFMVYRKSLDA